MSFVYFTDNFDRAIKKMTEFDVATTDCSETPKKVITKATKRSPRRRAPVSCSGEEQFKRRAPDESCM